MDSSMKSALPVRKHSDVSLDEAQTRAGACVPKPNPQQMSLSGVQNNFKTFLRAFTFPNRALRLER